MDTLAHQLARTQLDLAVAESQRRRLEGEVERLRTLIEDYDAEARNCPDQGHHENWWQAVSRGQA